MGFLDKLMFWKHDDEFDFDKATAEHGIPGMHDDMPTDDLGLAEKSPFPEEHEEHDLPSLGEEHKPEAPKAFGEQKRFQQAPSPPMENKELELINSKLDTIKAMLNNIDNRIGNLEKVAGVEKKERLW